MGIMGFRDLSIEYSYETGQDDLVNDFYIPVLSKSVNYDRIAGFFTSSSLAVAARGISGLIRNCGKMRVIACPRMDNLDTKTIERVCNHPEEYLDRHLLPAIDKFENEIQRDHVSALGWMLANGYLEIKIALVKNSHTDSFDSDSLFHQKIGIMTDYNGDRLSFSGSINETASGWLKNVEEFKVFKEWEIGQGSYLDADVKRFDEFWCNQRPNTLIIPLPIAIEKKLIQIASEFSIERFIATDYIRTRKEKNVDDRLSLFPYQQTAFETWKNNECSLFFEMATGTGKTRTAIACINHFMKNAAPGIIIISCPQSTLSMQWKTEMESIGLKFDSTIIADGSNRNWRDALQKELKLLSVGFHKIAVVYTTHTTASDNDFVTIMSDLIGKTKVCFVGDEAHGLGAYRSKNALLNIYSHRVGLSATPSRWFDEYGTGVLLSYFGNRSFQFAIAQALTTINPLTNKPFLVEYEYHPIFISLTDDEIEQFKQLTLRIKKMAAYSKHSDEYQQKLERLLFLRANIEKNAVLKYDALANILQSLNITNTLIFTTDAQINTVMCMLQQRRIISHRFTQEQKTIRENKYNGMSERQYLIAKFKEGYYQALVAIKCLDEGIDIPIANTAIIMASSTNPREYVQRIGRVIRQAKEKKRAYIYDFVLEPDLNRLEDPDLVDFEYQIFKKEMTRVKDMSANSINNAQVLAEINEKLRRVSHGAQ